MNKPNLKGKDTLIVELFQSFKQSGLTTQALAEQSEVTSQTIRNWFYGETRSPQLAKLRSVAMALGYTLELVPGRIPNKGRSV